MTSFLSLTLEPKHTVDTSRVNMVYAWCLVLCAQNLQQLEERRVGKVQEYIQKSADIENDAIPIINTCIAGIVSTAKNVSPSEVH